MTDQHKRDHGGNLAAAIGRYGGTKETWIDLSTGINPCSYPLPDLEPTDWNALPDVDAQVALENAARAFWDIPDQAAVLAAPGASSLIAKIPGLVCASRVKIAHPTYNEHAAAFMQHGWTVGDDANEADSAAQVLVHPNNPDGRLWSAPELVAPFVIIDESFCDICPDQSLIEEAAKPGRIILKSFGKFWGLAGLRLGFAIGDPALIANLESALGPWPVSGPALRIGAAALQDLHWAEETRARLVRDARRLDRIILPQGAELAGGTDLFRLYRVDDAKTWQMRFAQHHIWSRIFPYSEHFLRLGLPDEQGWERIERVFTQ